MGLTKQYLRYVKSDKCNIIASTGCNISFASVNGVEGRYVATGACEDVIVWDLRLGEKALVFPGEKHEVTHLTVDDNQQSLAVGYADGTLKIYNILNEENVATFCGHRTAITCIKYDGQGHRIATGAKDSEIVVWDIVAECGVQRLSGHKGVITQIEFYKTENVLISCSKDSFIKFWDLVSGHCFKTLAGHISEVWGICLVRNQDFIVSGSVDAELRVWQISENDSSSITEKENTLLAVPDDDNFQLLSPLECTKAGAIVRSGRGRVVSIERDPTGKVIAVHGSGNSLELFYFLSETGSQTKCKKRMRKERKKLTKDTEDSNVKNPPPSDDASPLLVDIVRRLPVIKSSDTIRSVDLVVGNDKELRVIVSLRNNSIELYSLMIKSRSEATCLRRVISHGHRAEVRAVAFSSDNLAIVSAASESLKVWNRPTLANLRTVKTGYALCVTFVPGDRHAIVGTKEGSLQIIDITSGDLLEEIAAHSKELWSVALLPDQSGIVSGGGDSTIKLWNFELVPDKNNSKVNVLSLLHTRTLKVDESVLCVKVSPNSNFIAVALLDSTVKIFFLDTFKFFLSLYGHKLPVLCMDISYDSTLIATGSSDRNVKIWGMDFGDCHKSIFAHDDSVTGLAFVPKTHYFFTCGKDGSVKQWDADNFEKIITLEAHHGEAWNLAVSPDGRFVVSCGQDRVVRLFERSAEPLILSDEQEQEREKESENTLMSGPETVVPGHSDIKLSSRKTVTSEKAAELLIECLEVSKEYHALMKEAEMAKKPVPPPPAIMVAFNAKTPDEYLLQILLRIRASEIEEVLLFIPFTEVIDLLPRLGNLLSTPYVDVVCRVLVFLVKIHHLSITSNKVLQPVLQKLHTITKSSCSQIRDKMGVNLFGLLMLKKEIEEKEGVLFFIDATNRRTGKQRKKRQKERAIRRAILSV